MTNPPGESSTPPEEPGRPQPGPEQPAQDQPGYWEGQAQQPSYPPPGYPAQGQVQYAPDHPKATTALVLGILGVVLCQVIAPFAWAMGKRTVNEIDASQGRLGGRGAAQAAYILGIVGTVLLALSLIFLVIWLVFAVALIGGGVSASY